LPINLNSIAKALRAEEKSLEKRLGKNKTALGAFAGLSENSGPPKERRRKMSAADRRAIAAVQKKRWAAIKA
jgi:hypothetical protein